MRERELEKLLKALANRRRLQIIKLLKKKGETSVGNIAEEIGLSMKATSKHLSLLLIAGIVYREQRSLLGFYWLADDLPKSIRNIISWL